MSRVRDSLTKSCHLGEDLISGLRPDERLRCVVGDRHVFANGGLQSTDAAVRAALRRSVGHAMSTDDDARLSATLSETVLQDQIGAIVRQTRVAQGLRQDQLAAAAGVGLRFLVELERGKPTVRLAKVLAVLNALGCRLDVTPPPTAGGNA